MLNTRNMDQLNVVLKDLRNCYPGFEKVATKEDNEILCARIQAGDEAASTELICRNKALILKFIGEFYKGSDLDDAFVESCYWTIQAAKSFDINMNNCFSTYLYYFIKKAVYNELPQSAFELSTPRNIRNLRNRIKKYEKENDVVLTVEEMAKKFGVSIECANSIRRLDCKLTMLNQDANLDEGKGENEIGELIADENSFFEDDVLTDLMLSDFRKILKDVLTEKELDVISLRFGIGGGEAKTLEEVGNIYGVTRERIRQIESKAIRKLRRLPRVREIAEGIFGEAA